MTVPSGKINYAGQPLDSANPSNIIRLASGGIFPIPNGNFVFKLGAQHALQWLDSNTGLWHVLETSYTNNPIVVQSDGTNYRLINISGTIQGVNITANGSAYTQANTTVTFAAPASGITATATPIIGGSLSFTVTTAGTGYTNPYLIIPRPWNMGGTAGLCAQAVAIPALSAGTIASVTASFAGAGYVTAPSANTLTITPAQYQANPGLYDNGTALVIVDPAGTGAVITPAITNGTAASGGLTGLVMNNPGSGYDGTHIPAVTITSATGSSATATALPNMALTSVTVGGTNTGYTATILFTSSLGASGSPTALISGESSLARAARGTIPQSGGVLGTAAIEDSGSGFQTVPILRQVGNATVDGSVNATLTAVVGGVASSSLYWQIG